MLADEVTAAPEEGAIVAVLADLHGGFASVAGAVCFAFQIVEDLFFEGLVALHFDLSEVGVLFDLSDEHFSA